MKKPEKAACHDRPGIAMPLSFQCSSGVLKEVLVANEVPVAISYHGTTHAVMMATPDNLEDFALGFSLTEGLIQEISEIENLEVVSVPDGLVVQIALVPARRDALRARRRLMAGPVGCGLCGIESIEAAMRPGPVFEGYFHISAGEISKAVAALCRNQPLNDTTRCTHAAGFYRSGEGLVAVREDIGRHNALDKLIGFLLRCRQYVRHGIIIVTSRLSVEMVQKTAMAGVPLLAAISAPTARAVQIAHQANITLVTRVRDGRFEIFTCPERVEE